MHRGYLEGLLVKERTKLARVRHGGPDAIAAPHAELGRMTLDELRELLGPVDAAMAAAAGRRRALGLPPTGEGGAVVETARVDSGPWAAGGSSSSDDGGYPMQQQQQGPGGADLLQLAMWHGGGMMQQPDRCNGRSPGSLKLRRQRCNGAPPVLQWSVAGVAGLQ